MACTKYSIMWAPREKTGPREYGASQDIDQSAPSDQNLRCPDEVNYDGFKHSKQMYRLRSVFSGLTPPKICFFLLCSSCDGREFISPHEFVPQFTVCDIKKSGQVGMARGYQCFCWVWVRFRDNITYYFYDHRGLKSVDIADPNVACRSDSKPVYTEHVQSVVAMEFYFAGRSPKLKKNKYQCWSWLRKRTAIFPHL